MRLLRQFIQTCVVAAVSAAATAVPSADAAQLPTGPFTVKAPEMTIPVGAKRGSLRRIIQPFGPWTLICDENLALRKRVCNVSQTIIDATGETVFSWSLAASEDGAPVFVVRLPAALAGDHFVQILFGKMTPLETGVILSLCNAATCLGYLTADAKIQRQIAAQAEVTVKVRIGPNVHAFVTSLDGLKQAVASLK